MGIIGWTYVFVIITFGIYIGIAFWARAVTTQGFYVARRGVPTVVNGCLLYTSPSPRD